MTDPRELLERWLRQQRDLGESEVVLDRLDPGGLPALLRPAAPSPASALPSPSPALPSAPPSASAARSAPAAPSRPEAPARPPRPSSPPAPGGAARLQADPPAPPEEFPDAETIVRLPTLRALGEVAHRCPRCELARTRRHVVFGEGAEDADLMVVGEAPGAREDASGRPFVGPAGKLLDLLLASVGFPRERVYICNVLKCRPPGNANPTPGQVEACSPYLLRQVELVAPRAILAFGTFAAQTLLGTTTPVGRLRGRSHDYHGVPLIPTYHPAALLRNPGWVRPVWEDLQRMREIVDPS